MRNPTWMRIVCGVLATALLPGLATAKLNRQTVNYGAGDVQGRGYLVYDDAVSGPRPGVLVVHEWWGLNDTIKNRADQLAGMGYVALAADMYGDGKTTTDPKQAAAWAGQVKNSPLLRERAQLALQILKQQPGVDPKRLAAIGFCFGGTTVLELAYAGADLAGVVVFHGGLTVPGAEDLGRIKPKLLILHGSLDPYTPPATIQTLRETLDKARVDYQMIYYSGAAHAFTNPTAGNHPESGAAYNEVAAKRAWAQMQTFFQEVLTPVR